MIATALVVFIHNPIRTNNKSGSHLPPRYVSTSLNLLILYLFDTVDPSKEERQYLRMIQYNNLHSYLLDRAEQTNINTV